MLFGRSPRSPPKVEELQSWKIWGLFISSYESHKERRTGKIRGASSRMHKALDGWMLARAPASPAQGLHHHGPRYFIFSNFCTKQPIMRIEDRLFDRGWVRSAMATRNCGNIYFRKYFMAVRKFTNIFVLLLILMVGSRDTLFLVRFT